MQVLWSFVLCSLTVSAYRLPTSITPSRYKVKILSHLGEPDNFNFDGKVWIQMICHEATQNITLHSKELNLTNSHITVKDISSSPRTIGIANVELDTDNEFLIIKLEKRLEKDHRYELFIPFKGVMVEGIDGFYRSSYVDEKTNETKWLEVTHFEATNARKVFPCFDEPAMKAIFEITLGRNKDYSSLGNMPLLATEPIKEKSDWYWDKYTPTPPMSTYLVALAISNLQCSLSEYSQKGLPVRVCARRSVTDQVQLAKEVSAKSLQYYKDFFGVDYPLPKFDLVAAPKFISAMENWGLLIFRESYILYSNISSLRDKNRVALALAHELSHQWFGNLVTMQWWTDLWLKEGFAVYFASKAVGHLYPQWRSEEEDTLESITSVFFYDSLNSSHPVSVSVGNDPLEIVAAFDTMSYDKGSFVVRTMAQFLGEDTFRKGCKNYLTKYAYKNTQPDDLWWSFNEEAYKAGVLSHNLTVKMVMDAWISQTGYPLVTVTRDYRRNKMVITQQRYFQNRSLSDNSSWWIPITYTDGQEGNFNSTKPKFWLSCPKQTLIIDCHSDSNTWILFNLKINSLYRVNYDERNWNLITEFLNSDSHVTIPALDKVQLIANAFDLASTDYVKFDIWFGLVKYLRREEEYLPWKKAIDNFQYLYVQFMKTPLIEDLKTYLQRLVFPAYVKLGESQIFEDHKLDNLPLIKLQEIIASWACRLGSTSCISKTQELFRNYQKNPNSNTVPRNFKSVVYCAAIRSGGEEEWNFLLEQYKKTNVPSEKSTILTSLGCANNTRLLNRYLDLSLKDDSGIASQDSFDVFSAVVSQENGFEIAKNFLFTRTKDINDHLSGTASGLVDYLLALRSVLTREEEMEELKIFLKDNQEYFEGSESSILWTLEIVELNIQWRTRHLTTVQRLLKNHPV